MHYLKYWIQIATVREHQYSAISTEILPSPSWQDWLDLPNSRQESKGKCNTNEKKTCFLRISDGLEK